MLPKPSQIVVALFTEWKFIWPHLLITLYELLVGFAIGGSIGFILAAVITQFPFVEKVVTPYILLLVTTPMLALVPLLILRFGFGSEPRIIAVALASGPMVMINSATGFRRVDLAKIALARSFGASTFQIFTKIRIPMAMPMIIVGLMVGSIFGLLTTIGAEMVGRRRGPRQPPDLLLGADPHAAVLRDHPDPRDTRHFDLRVLLLARQEMGELGGVRTVVDARESRAKTKEERRPASGILDRSNRRRLLDIDRGRGFGASPRTARQVPVSARAADTVRWVIPRGTIEVLDDYPYWVGKKFGYFGDHRNDAGARAVGRHRDRQAGRPEPGRYGLSVAGRFLAGAGAGNSAGLGLPHGRRRRVRLRVPQG